MVRWQYRVVNVGMFNAADRLAAVLGLMGENGWELVGIYDKSSNWLSGMEKGFALFKRPVLDGSMPDGAWAEVASAKAMTTAAAEQYGDPW
jgi:hypothetical protein